MYHDLQEVLLGDGLKMNIAEFVAKCTNCHEVKVENLNPSGVLQEIQIPT